MNISFLKTSNLAINLASTHIPSLIDYPQNLIKYKSKGNSKILISQVFSESGEIFAKFLRVFAVENKGNLHKIKLLIFQTYIMRHSVFLNFKYLLMKINLKK